MSPEDYPKIIKSGIDEEGQHHKSPNITGPSGIATLLHRIGRQQLLERLFDTTGTEEYNLCVLTGKDYWKDLYVIRQGVNVEVSSFWPTHTVLEMLMPVSRLQIGFINSDGDWAQHGVRYRISPETAGSLYRVGKWIPLSTSDLGSPWGGSDVWVRGQGAAVATAIWFQEYFDFDIEVSWSGMTEGEKEDLATWLKDRAEQLAERRRVEKQEYEERKAKYGKEHYRIEEKMGMQAHYRSRLVCRADCGEQNPKLYCSKCKIARKSLLFIIVVHC